MIELLRTNDAVLLTFLEALLRDDGIACIILDRHTSILEGSLNMLPQRLMIAREDEARARHLLELAEMTDV